MRAQQTACVTPSVQTRPRVVDHLDGGQAFRVDFEPLVLVGYAFVANGGTDDVSALDVRRLLAGRPDAEVRRIATGVGPWGLAINSAGSLVAVGSRESAEIGIEGNTVSLIDVSQAISGHTGAIVAKVRVGTDGAKTASRPFGLTFTPDCKRVLIANFRTNDLSVLDVWRAIAGDPNAEVARIPLVLPDGRPARPRGVAATPTGGLLL